MTHPLLCRFTRGTSWVLTIRYAWDGDVLGADETVTVTMELSDAALTLRVDAPFHGDPTPGRDSLDDLWNYEVVEVMLLGEGDAYLEVELSPHGQYLVLFLRGERNIVRRGDDLDYRADIVGGRWHGVAHVPVAWLPADTDRLNAFAMHGTDAKRRYLAWKPSSGSRPDFHRLSAFGFFDDGSMVSGTVGARRAR